MTTTRAMYLKTTATMRKTWAVCMERRVAMPWNKMVETLSRDQ